MSGLDEEKLRIVYVLDIGTDVNGENIYHIFLSEDCDKTWAEGWENKPAGIIRNLTPEEDMYEYVAEIRTKLKFDLAQHNTCFSMQDCRDKIIAIASENLDEAEEYPEEGRIVIHFGDLFEDVEKSLAKRDIVIKMI